MLRADRKSRILGRPAPRTARDARPSLELRAPRAARAARDNGDRRDARNRRASGSAFGGVSRFNPFARFGDADWSRVRLYGVGCVFAVLWALLWSRAWYVQVYDGDRLAGLARRQHMAAETVSGRRGAILDRNGQILARSVEVRSVYVRPGEVRDVDATVNALAAALEAPAKHVRDAVTSKRGFSWVARKVDDLAAENVRKAGLPGVYLSSEYERIYPFKQMAGQLLGFVGMESKGLEGLELTFDEVLSGDSARNVVQRDAAGRRLDMDGGAARASLRGRDVRLTIDTQVQFFAEEALARSVDQFDASWGGCLVVDVDSGDILAWAQYPFFNPNSYRDYKADRWRNRLAADALEPGSTLKPFLVAAALQEGVVKGDTSFNCEKGRWKTRYITIRDTHSYDVLPVNKVLRYSSNIGMAKIGLELGAKRYWEYLNQLGFGDRTGLPITESKGILRDPRHWSEPDLITTSFGQSIAATGVQMAQAYLTLANGGERKPLRLVVDTGDDAPANSASQKVYNDKTVKQVISMLREVVEEDGTGTRARIPGIMVGGKTGTAQKADETGRYGHERLASFVGFAPIDRPKYLILVMVDEPQKNSYGGVVAAPVFKHVAMRTMAYHGLLPDAPDPEAPAYATPLGKTGPVEVRREVAEAVREAPDGVPNVVGKSVRRAVEVFARQGMVPILKGAGQTVIRQTPEPGTEWPKGQPTGQCVLWLSENS